MPRTERRPDRYGAGCHGMAWRSHLSPALSEIHIGEQLLKQPPVIVGTCSGWAPGWRGVSPDDRLDRDDLVVTLPRFHQPVISGARR